MEEFYKKDLFIKASIDNKSIKNLNVTLEEQFDHKCKLIVHLEHLVVITKDNFFECLSEFKFCYPNIILFCKGYKINVYPSRMFIQMGMGLKAYEMELGEQATFDNVVSLFDYEEHDLTSSVELQKEYYFKWLNSLCGN
ncbi:hypothetical protein BKK54_11290 [Rodentibacter genomosp. 1]|uniref:Uncharacterized protein n=1 Tax=Rodentibacter genomosp. 1 TaxID=1908264 RepID=A0A1V3IZS5_9PAST|nr:hypothetical protein [Rodentibacter genomosp. 1]OOF48005.1 hypothetical protein BKK54_11290 [Rodentibacter genomosp. 1]